MQKLPSNFVRRQYLINYWCYGSEILYENRMQIRLQITREIKCELTIAITATKQNFEVMSAKFNAGLT